MHEPGVEEPRRSPLVPGEISPDQVKDGGENGISKSFSHLTLLFFTVLSSVYLS
jgi:hypothetical protein